jgi:hypothetical protein
MKKNRVKTDPVMGVPLMPKDTRRWRQATTEQRKMIEWLSSLPTRFGSLAIDILTSFVEDIEEYTYHHYLHKTVYDALMAYKPVVMKKNDKALTAAYTKAIKCMRWEITMYVDGCVTDAITTLYTGRVTKVTSLVYPEEYKNFLTDLADFPFLNTYQPQWQRAFLAALLRTDLDTETSDGIFFLLLRHFDWHAFTQEAVDYLVSHPGVSVDRMKEIPPELYEAMPGIKVLHGHKTE